LLVNRHRDGGCRDGGHAKGQKQKKLHSDSLQLVIQRRPICFYTRSCFAATKFYTLI
jgi:hypothetical protein